MTVVNVTDAVLKGSMKGPTGTAELDGTIFTGTVSYDAGTTEPPVESEITAPIIDWLRPASNLTDDALRTMNGGTANYNNPVVFGRSDYPAATVTVHLNNVSQGTATTDSGGNWNYALPVLGNAAYALKATVASGGKTSAATTFTFTVSHQASSGSTGGLIANFTGLNEKQWKLDGVPIGNQNANTNGDKPWCLQKKDDYTLRFENRQGDDWDSPYAGTGCNRNEVGVGDGEVYCFADGVEGNGSFTLTVEPGPVNTSSWCTIVQVHALSDTPPCPFAMGLEQNTDKLSVVLQDPVGGNNYIYTAPSGMVRGQAYKIRFQFKMGPSGGGYARVWINDAQVVNFSGKIGASGNTKYYYKFGIYRGAVAETLSMVFKNVYLRPSYKDGAWVNT